MQRLLSEAVSCQQQTFSALIPECEREHPTQPLHALGPKLLVQVNDHLSVSAGVEAVATSFQRRAQLWEVVDLPIEDDPNSSVLVVDGLMPRRQIDDTQPAHAQRGTPLSVDSFVVRSAVHDGLAHLMDVCTAGQIVMLGTDDACYSTHGFLCLSSPSSRTASDFKLSMLSQAFWMPDRCRPDAVGEWGSPTHRPLPRPPSAGEGSPTRRGDDGP